MEQVSGRERFDPLCYVIRNYTVLRRQPTAQQPGFVSLQLHRAIRAVNLNA
jgi:hypothetical protein